jgi:NitT/TauT family transport system substrate-binding protein
VRAVVAVGTILFSLAASAVSGNAATTIRIGVIPINDTLPLYAAVDQGLMTAEGIDAQLIPLPSGTRVLEAMAGGSVDMGLSATLSILQAAEQGLDLVIVQPAAFARADSKPVNGVMVLKESGIRSAADLRRKVIGVNALKNIGYLMVVEYLRRGGVSPDQVTWQELPVPQMPAALETRRVDAVNAVEPFVTVLRESGKSVLLSAGEDILPNTSISAIATLRSWRERNRSALDAFGRAYEKAIDFVNRNPAAAREILIRYTKAPADLAQRMNIQVFRRGIAPADIALQQEMARRHQLLGTDVSLDRILPGPQAR